MIFRLFWCECGGLVIALVSNVQGSHRKFQGEIGLSSKKIFKEKNQLPFRQNTHTNKRNADEIVRKKDCRFLLTSAADETTFPKEFIPVDICKEEMIRLD